MLTAILLGALLLGAAVVALFGWDEVISWFQRPDVSSLVEEDEQNIAFTVKQDLDNGNYRVVQGVFNRRTDKLHVQQSRNVEAAELDDELEAAHEGQALVVYN